MARVLFTTFGSYGDVHPYLAIGRELRKLGHEAGIATSAGYREKVEAAGLTLVSVRPDLKFADPELIRYFFDRVRGTERVVRAMASVVRETYEDTLAAAHNFDVIVTHPLSFAAVLAAQKLRLPWVSTVLAPASFVSACDPPVPGPLLGIVKVRTLGAGAMRLTWRLLMLATVGWTQPVAELRREIGLAPGRNPLFEGSHSPDLVLALFSKIFAKPQPDWPRQTVVTGFPFYHEDSGGLAPAHSEGVARDKEPAHSECVVRDKKELAAFLDSGPPPVVFTLGSSAVMAAGDFYSASLQAVERVNARALFLTGPSLQGLPTRLPPSVLAWPYAPHEQVFPRASAIVHQAGIGTTAQALRSGRPSLAVPFAHDQFDNAERVCRLGVGLTISRHRYTERAAAQALARLLGTPLATPSYEQSARAVGEAIREENGAAAAAQEIDGYLTKRKISNTGRPLESKTV
ncbi:MAG TPA: glycosyltransferase [Bryobacteraceae bacterium]